MTDLEALNNNIEIVSNLKKLILRAPHIHNERQAVDQCIAFIDNLLEQSEALKKQLTEQQQTIEQQAPVVEAKPEQA